MWPRPKGLRNSLAAKVYGVSPKLNYTAAFRQRHCSGKLLPCSNSTIHLKGVKLGYVVLNAAPELISWTQKNGAVPVHQARMRARDDGPRFLPSGIFSLHLPRFLCRRPRSWQVTSQTYAQARRDGSKIQPQVRSIA